MEKPIKVKIATGDLLLSDVDFEKKSKVHCDVEETRLNINTKIFTTPLRWTYQSFVNLRIKASDD
jgi:hypothetical protein